MKKGLSAGYGSKSNLTTKGVRYISLAYITINGNIMISTNAFLYFVDKV